METITAEGHEIVIALESSIDDAVNLISPEGIEYVFGTHAAIFESDGHDFYVLRNMETGEVESDAYNAHDPAEDAAKLGLTIIE